MHLLPKREKRDRVFLLPFRSPFVDPLCNDDVEDAKDLVEEMDEPEELTDRVMAFFLSSFIRFTTGDKHKKEGRGKAERKGLIVQHIQKWERQKSLT